MSRVQFDTAVSQLATRIPRRLHHAVRLAAFHQEVTMQEWVADALAAYLREHQTEEEAREA